MRSVGEQFLARGCTRNAGAVDPDPQPFVKAVGQTQRARECVEIALDAERDGIDLGPLVANGTFDLDRTRLVFLQQEQAQLVGAVGRDERLFADRREVAEIVLRAKGATQSTAFGLDELGPGLDALDIEHRAHFVAFELGVGVVAIADAGEQPVDEPATEGEFTAEIGSELTQIDGHRRFFFLAAFGLVAFLAVMMACAGSLGHAVGAVVPADGRTQAAVTLEEAEAGVDRPGIEIAVGQFAAAVGDLAQFFRLAQFAFLFLFRGIGQQIGAQRGRHDVAGNLQIAGIAIGAIDVEDEAVADRRVDRSAEIVFVVDGVVTGQPVEVDGFVGHAARDALVDDVDGAADRLAAVKQHGRAAQHFDTLGSQRVDADRVIVRGVRGVDRADAVDQHAHALAREAAQDGPADAGREARRGHAGNAFQHVADLAGKIALQFRAFDDAGAGKDVESLEAGRRDDDQPLRVDLAIVEIVRRRSVGRRSLFGGGLRENRLGSQKRDGGDGRQQAASAFCMIQHYAPINAVCANCKGNAPCPAAGSTKSLSVPTNGLPGSGYSGAPPTD